MFLIFAIYIYSHIAVKSMILNGNEIKRLRNFGTFWWTGSSKGVFGESGSLKHIRKKVLIYECISYLLVIILIFDIFYVK